MDVWRITVAALRRWYVLVPLLALTVLGMLAVGRGIKPEYDATGTVMIVPGRSVPAIPNPYGAVDDANAAVGIVLNSPESRSEITSRGLSPNYQVAPQSRSTIMNFSVRADSPKVAVETGEAVFGLAEQELNSRQAAAGIPPGARYRIDVLQPSSLSAVVKQGKTRNIAVVGILGAGLSLVIAVFFDDIAGLVRTRRRRKEQASTGEAQRGTGSDPLDESESSGDIQGRGSAEGDAGDDSAGRQSAVSDAR